jgi:hypothetical protein
MSTDSQRAGSAERTASPWATGIAAGAGMLMILAGFVAVLEGIAALFNDRVYVGTPRYIFAFDLTTWGWIHLLLGVLVGVAGVAVLSGKAWGRFVGMVLAGLSLVAHFLFLPHYPLWSIIIIALDVAIIWALAVYRDTNPTP